MTDLTTERTSGSGRQGEDRQLAAGARRGLAPKKARLFEG